VFQQILFHLLPALFDAEQQIARLNPFNQRRDRFEGGERSRNGMPGLGFFSRFTVEA
jgi:hypothetical protein